MSIKQKFSVLAGIVISAIMAISFVSCSNDEYDAKMSRSFNSYSNDECDTRISTLQVERDLQDYAIIHNSGLNFIKEKVAQTPNGYRLDSIFNRYVRLKYSYDESAKIISEISPLTNQFFSKTTPTSIYSYNGLVNIQDSKNNELASKALNTCMDKIRYCLDSVNDDNMFDNKYLLSNLHIIITDTYKEYSDNCKSKFDMNALTETLGVLYGSVEYWSNSNNVDSWSDIQLSYTSTESATLQNRVGTNHGNNKRRKKEKLSRSEWIQTVAAADASGALAGSYFGPHAAAAAGLAASAAAAIAFDVRK